LNLDCKKTWNENLLKQFNSTFEHKEGRIVNLKNYKIKYPVWGEKRKEKSRVLILTMDKKFSVKILHESYFIKIKRPINQWDIRILNTAAPNSWALKFMKNQVWWLIPVIPSMQEVETEGSHFKVSPSKKIVRSHHN
jgi:hypothetical protein